jgi:succinate dehydrogenase / fumarate reductase flavoprotein subunit
MEITLTALLKDGGRVSGAIGYNRDSGKLIVFKAKAVVLATGGWGKMFKITSNSWESTGDGGAMAYDAGAELKDMEFVQFHPTGMVWPPGVRGLLVTEAVRGDGGILTNSKGDRFMFKPEYMPAQYVGQYAESPEEANRWLTDKTNYRRPPELLPRDVVARSIYKEVQAGLGSEHGGAYLDIRHRGAKFIKEKLPSMYDQFHTLGDIDITTQRMEVAPTIHYTMGGIRSEADSCATTLAGLYAAGECACGLHGANRLGGNSLSDLLVFGKRAGEYAAEFASKSGEVSLDEGQIEAETSLLLAPFAGSGNENPFQMHKELQAIMGEHAGIARTTQGLADGLAQLLKVKQRLSDLKAQGGREYNPSWHTCRDVRSMVTLAEAILRCAAERKESRGGHWYLDYPDESEVWAKQNTIAVQENGEMSVRTVPLAEMPAALQALFEDPAKVAVKA